MPRNPAASAPYLSAVDVSFVCSNTIASAMATRPPTASIVEWSGSYCQRQSGHMACRAVPASSAPTLHTVARRYSVRGRLKIVRVAQGNRRKHTPNNLRNQGLLSSAAGGNSRICQGSGVILAATGQATVNPKKGPKSCTAENPVTYRLGRLV